MVFRRCRFLLKDDHSAEDAMQEVFMRVFVHKQKLKDEYPSSLLFKIATNVCLNIIRNNKKAAEAVDDEVINQIAYYDDSEKRFLNNETIKQIFSNTNESTKSMAIMHYVDGMTLEQVAREHNMSVSGVRKRLRVFKEKVKHMREIDHEL